MTPIFTSEDVPLIRIMMQSHYKQQQKIAHQFRRYIFTDLGEHVELCFSKGSHLGFNFDLGCCFGLQEKNHLHVRGIYQFKKG